MITLEQVLKAYEYANSHPHKYLRGTTNWCAAVAHSLNEQTPAAQCQDDPVAFEVDVSGYTIMLAKTADKAEKTAQHYRAMSHTVDIRPLFRRQSEQPAPVVRCSFCDVTDNAGNPWSGHHESVDGKLIYRVTGCKDHKHLVEALDGSKPAPVAVAMPERMDAAPFTTIDRGSKNYKAGYNAALTEVARLNEVKP